MFTVRWFTRAYAQAGVVVLAAALTGCGHHEKSAGPSPAPAAAPAPKPQPAKPDGSLYSRLGGADGITAFTDDFLGRATNDPVIIPFFRGLTPADLQRIRQHVIELLCSATGGPCVYSGKDMKTTHAQMEINSEAWNAFTGHLNETVARFGIGDRERNELVVIVQSLRKDIVNR